ncbi:MAG: hypothetical protein AMJ56_21225 [Anaerolineae bacterium SG8_19]|nr:MAG: hypothetical protein AMJ56_21225 [Anaerolineae bacterium SG8_19]
MTNNNPNGSRLRFLILSFLLSIPALVFAQAPEQTEAFVYGINAAIPGAVIGTFAPPIVGEIYLMADDTSILSPRRTRVYYWPITNEYRAAWSQLNEQVDGVLEVLQGGQLVATYEQMPYTIHFSAGEGAAKPQLFIGDEAFKANDRFLADQMAYRQATEDYQVAREEWLEAARQAQARGEDSTDLPPSPIAPKPFNTFSTGLNSGYPVDLEEGTYQIQTRLEDGTILPESKRDLVVFAPRRTAVGYEVVPEARWTFPEELNDLSDAILGEDDTVLYLKPHIVREYPAIAYERLQDPQSASDASRSEWTWVSGETLDEGILEIVQNGEVEGRIPLESYFVKQVPGKEFGYEILPYDPNNPDLTPRVDFTGYRVKLSADQPAYEVRLRSLDDELLLGSDREVRVVQPVSLPALLLISSLPLAFGAVLILWRRRRTALKQGSNDTS